MQHAPKRGAPQVVVVTTLEALRAFMREVDDGLGAKPTEPELVDVTKALPMPKRSALALARSGAIRGAVKVGRVWMATRAALAAYLASRAPTMAPEAEAEAEPWTPARALARAGLRAAGGGR